MCTRGKLQAQHGRFLCHIFQQKRVATTRATYVIWAPY